MNQAIEPAQAAPEAGRRPAPSRRKAPAAAPHEVPQPDLDLDRLVWDPEYRRAMAPRLKHVG